jgi:hypothetical protein
MAPRSSGTHGRTQRRGRYTGYRATKHLANNAIVVARVRTKDNIVLAAGTHVIRSGKNRFVRVTVV